MPRKPIPIKAAVAKKSNIFAVSQSKINLWRRCKYAAHLRYVERLKKKVKSRPLRFGSLVHDMIEADADNKDPFKVLDESMKAQSKLFASEREEVMETIADARFIMTDYFQFWKEQPADKQYVPMRRQGKGAEHAFTVPLVDGIEVTAKMDMFATGANRTKLLVENKSFSRMPTDDHRWRNLQSNLYKWIADKVGIQVDRICWNYIRSKSPSFPQMKKDGSPSAKKLDTLPSALREFGKREGVIVPGTLLTNAKANRKTYFLREFSRAIPQTVKSLVADFTESAIEMSEQLGKSRAKTVDRHCEWCDFESICRAELKGLDRDFIIKKDFIRHEDEEQTVAEV